MKTFFWQLLLRQPRKIDKNVGIPGTFCSVSEKNTGRSARDLPVVPLRKLPAAPCEI